MWKSEISIGFMIFSPNINLNNEIKGNRYRKRYRYPKALSVRITGPPYFHMC